MSFIKTLPFAIRNMILEWYTEEKQPSHLPTTELADMQLYGVYVDDPSRFIYRMFLQHPEWTFEFEWNGRGAKYECKWMWKAKSIKFVIRKPLEEQEMQMIHRIGSRMQQVNIHLSPCNQSMYYETWKSVQTCITLQKQKTRITCRYIDMNNPEKVQILEEMLQDSRIKNITTAYDIYFGVNTKFAQLVSNAPSRTNLSVVFSGPENDEPIPEEDDHKKWNSFLAALSPKIEWIGLNNVRQKVQFLEQVVQRLSQKQFRMLSVDYPAWDAIIPPYFGNLDILKSLSIKLKLTNWAEFLDKGIFKVLEFIASQTQLSLLKITIQCEDQESTLFPSYFRIDYEQYQKVKPLIKSIVDKRGSTAIDVNVLFRQPGGCSMYEFTLEEFFLRSYSIEIRKRTN